MRRRAALGRLVGATVMFCALGTTAGPAHAWVVHGSNGRAYGLELRPGVAPASVNGSVAASRHYSGLSANGNLDYHGGPVLHSSSAYVIFWDPANSIATSTRNLILRYFQDAAHDNGLATNVYAVDRQFNDAAGSADYSQSFGGSLSDATAYPTNGCTDPFGTHSICLSDSQLVKEIHSDVVTKTWPTGLAPIYYIVTPPTVVTCETTGSPCSDNVFCAYHSGFLDGGGNEYLYANIPMTLMDGVVNHEKGCQYDGNSAVQEPNGDIGDVVLKYISHEHNETITDPEITGWYNSNGGAEDGDQCSSVTDNSNAFLPTLGGNSGSGTLYNQLINGHEYYIQSEWSNGDIGCRMQPSAGTIAPAFTVPGNAGAGTPLSIAPTGTTSSNPITGLAWDYGDGTGTFTVGPSLTTVQHTYAAGGDYTVRLTVFDDRGNAVGLPQPLHVHGLPVPAFTVSGTPQAGVALGFDGSGSTDPDGGTLTYTWSFSDGTSGGGQTTTHAFAAGIYTVRLTVTDSFGLSASATHTVAIRSPAPPPPIPASPITRLSGDVVTIVPGQTRASALAHGVRVRVTCHDSCSIGSRVLLRVLVRSGRHHKKLQLIELGHASSRLGAAGQAQLTIPLNSAAKRRLRRLRSPLVTISTSVTRLNPADAPVTQSNTTQLRLPG
jgi:hypothetical protein